MHLVPEGRRIVDGERACEAIAAVGEPDQVSRWAQRFGLLGDPGRLALLLAISGAGPISVTDLAAATGMHDTTVSQALRLLRASSTVVARRDGRVVRYELADAEVGRLLAHVAGPPALHRHAAH